MESGAGYKHSPIGNRLSVCLCFSLLLALLWLFPRNLFFVLPFNSPAHPTLYGAVLYKDTFEDAYVVDKAVEYRGAVLGGRKGRCPGVDMVMPFELVTFLTKIYLGR